MAGDHDSSVSFPTALHGAFDWTHPFQVSRSLSWNKDAQSCPTHAGSCPTPCDPMDYTVLGILQARILEWVAFPFSRDLCSSGIKPTSPALQVDSLPTELSGKPWLKIEDLKSVHTNRSPYRIMQWLHAFYFQLCSVSSSENWCFCAIELI